MVDRLRYDNYIYTPDYLNMYSILSILEPTNIAYFHIISYSIFPLPECANTWLKEVLARANTWPKEVLAQTF